MGVTGLLPVGLSMTISVSGTFEHEGGSLSWPRAVRRLCVSLVSEGVLSVGASAACQIQHILNSRPQQPPPEKPLSLARPDREPQSSFCLLPALCALALHPRRDLKRPLLPLSWGVPVCTGSQAAQA